ncbi:molecular chaperone TorD family protein [bacterium]|nr:molecular chaperone TorD family protein [bacterium]
MKFDNAVFHFFAHILSYPEAKIQDHADFLVQALKDTGVAKKLRPFSEFLRNSKFTDIEELFTSTFDMNAARCLEIGWHLYGEDYRRGEFLVQMRQSLAEEKLSESGELPDHVSHCLRLLERLTMEDGREFSKGYLLPALEKISSSFEDKECNPYLNVVEALQTVLRLQYDLPENHPALKVIPSESPTNGNHKAGNLFMV